MNHIITKIFLYHLPSVPSMNRPSRVGSCRSQKRNQQTNDTKQKTGRKTNAKKARNEREISARRDNITFNIN